MTQKAVGCLNSQSSSLREDMTKRCLQTVILDFSWLSFLLSLCYILCIIPSHFWVLVLTAPGCCRCLSHQFSTAHPPPALCVLITADCLLLSWALIIPRRFSLPSMTLLHSPFRFGEHLPSYFVPQCYADRLKAWPCRTNIEFHIQMFNSG